MEKLNFNFGGSGSSPVIQTAGAQRIIEEEPRQLFSTGRYAKVPLMCVILIFKRMNIWMNNFLLLLRIGANKHDGSFILGGSINNGNCFYYDSVFYCFPALYRLNLAPNNLTNNSTYLENQLVPDLLRIFGIIFKQIIIKRYHNLSCWSNLRCQW